MNSVARGMNQIGKKSYNELITCLIAVFLWHDFVR